MIDPKEYFKSVGYAILQGYNYRGLEPVVGPSRTEFKRLCFQAIEDSMREFKTPQEKEEARLTAIRAIAERSLFFFVIFCLRLDWVDNDYGYRLCNDVQKHKWDSLYCIAREHYKSLIITCASTLWELIKDPNRTYLFGSYNVSQAQSFLGNVKKWCEEVELLRMIWPDVFWEEPSRGYATLPNGKKVTWTWTQKALEFKRTRLSKEKSIEVTGIQGGLRTGGHFSHIIFDDAETPDTVVTPESIQKCFDSIVMATNIGQTANLNMCFIGTFYAKDDLYVRLIQHNFFKDSIVIQPCYDWDTQELILYTPEQNQNKLEKMGLDAYLTQMLCDPSLSQSSAFKSEWWKSWKAENLNNLNIYIVVDPAGNKQNKDNDNSVMLVVGIDQFANIMVIDVVRDKLTSETKFRTLVDLYGKYRPIGVYYEQESMQSDIDLINTKMEVMNIRFAIIPFNMKKWGSKKQRIDMLITPLANSQIWFCEEAWHYNYKGEKENMVESLKLQEFHGYPLIKHDDGLDCLASAYIMLLKGTFMSPNRQSLLRGNSLSGFKGAIDVPFEEVEDSFEGLI